MICGPYCTFILLIISKNLSMCTYFIVFKFQGFCLRTYMNQLREAPFRCIIELEHQCMSNYM